MKGRVHVEELSQQICPTIKVRPANNRNSTAPTPHQTPQAAEVATLLRQHLRRFFYHLSSHKIMLVPLSLSDSADDRVLGQSSLTMTYPSAQNLRMLRNPSLEDEESRVVTGGEYLGTLHFEVASLLSAIYTAGPVEMMEGHHLCQIHRHEQYFRHQSVNKTCLSQPAYQKP
jgi:hypothetical protein